MRTFLVGVGATLLIGAALAVTSAQNLDPAQLLLQARSVRCELGQGTQASWDGGNLSLKQGTFGAGSTLTFDSIDAKKGSARIIGNAGADDVLVLQTPTGLTFIEQTAIGNVNVTTVFARPVGPGNLVAVSSRHQDINGPFPSQWHGTCRILQ